MIQAPAGDPDEPLPGDPGRTLFTHDLPGPITDLEMSEPTDRPVSTEEDEVLVRSGRTVVMFGPEELAGIRDYWDLYERHYEEIRLVLLAELASDEEVGRLLRNTPADVLEEQGKRSLEISRRAILDGEWEPYLENLRAQGATYAKAGLSFSAWFRIISAFRPHVVKRLLAAFASDTGRLVRAVDGMDRLLDLALSAIGEAYLGQMEEVIARQREAIGELRTRARVQVILSSIADGVITTDPFGNIMTINLAMEKLAGVGADDAIGRPYHEIYPVLKDGELLEVKDRYLTRAIEQRTTLQSERSDLRLVCPDGRELPVTITAAPIIEEGGRLLGGVAVVRALQNGA
jgi:PAS domain S-box-containing protein